MESFFCCCLRGVAATETHKQLQTIVLFIDNRTKLKTKFFSMYYVVVYEASTFFKLDRTVHDCTCSMWLTALGHLRLSLNATHFFSPQLKRKCMHQLYF